MNKIMSPDEAARVQKRLEAQLGAALQLLPKRLQDQLGAAFRRDSSLAPRGLSRVEAAGYIGVGATLFDELVRDGRMPKPKRINSRTVWDRVALDEAFSALPGDDLETNPWDG